MIGRMLTMDEAGRLIRTYLSQGCGRTTAPDARRVKKFISGISPRSRCLLMIITQEPSQSLVTLNGFRATDIRISWEQQDMRPIHLSPLLPAHPRWAKLIPPKNVRDNARRGYAGSG
jgi:hypothetical protein